MTKISDYLDPRLVAFLSVDTRDEALRALVEAAAKAEKIQEEETFFEAIINREEIVSTGIGMGVAIPHSKLASYNDFFIAIGILKKGVDWKALDDSLVKIVFLIGGPDDKQTEYLQILSSLTVAIKDEERRKKLLSLKSAREVVDLFKDF